MTRITLSALRNTLALLLVLISLPTMAFLDYQFYAAPAEPEWANVFTGTGAVLAASVSASVAFRSVALVEEKRPYTYWQQTSLHRRLCRAFGLKQWKKTVQLKKVASAC